MDRRFLIPALAIDIIGLTIFSVLYHDANYAASLNSTATNATNAIIVLEASTTLGALATLIGLVHRAGISYKTAGALAFFSMALGLYSLWASLGLGIQNGDNLAASGGFPLGYWTNTEFNRCTAWIALQEGWVSTLLLVVLATSVTIFWASILALVIRVIHSNRRNDMDRLAKLHPSKEIGLAR